MSGPGDIDGEVSGDEAAWRDLIAHFDDPAAARADQRPWPSQEDLPDSSAAESGQPGQKDAAGAPPGSPAGLPGGPPPSGSLPPPDRIKVAPYLGGPRSYVPAEEEDERYVPVPLPPPARLDSVSKAAWVAVIGGPGYLLVVSLFLHLAVSPAAAFVAVAAFVGGFVTLVVKLGDHSRRDDDDDGAVL